MNETAACVPERQRQVDEQAGRLGNTIEDLRCLILELESRLSPVSVPAVECPADTCAGASNDLVPLAGRLKVFGDIVMDQGNEIRGILDRLEI